LFAFQGDSAERERRELIYQKQQMKERDGFCRRVDTYDGQVVVVDHKPTYELGNYLGGGVAGVVYEGHRLRPMEDYPVRHGAITDDSVVVLSPPSPEVEQEVSFFCSPAGGACGGGDLDDNEEETINSPNSTSALARPSKMSKKQRASTPREEVDVAIEATVNHETHGVFLDAQDATSRSRHYAKAASVQLNPKKHGASRGLSDETVAVKILNPVGFRLLPAEGLKGAVVVKEGVTMDAEVKKGVKPMEEKHVWWLVNPNSRNLRTLQRYSGKGKDGSPQPNTPRGIQVDRGTSDKGLRLSLIAAYIDPRTSSLRELTLTRCIEIWGHVPFSATDTEFENMMTAIERINAGQPPPPLAAFNSDKDHPASRVGTGGTEATESSTSHNSSIDNSQLSSVALKAQRT
jgi:hypothetical protein